MEVIANQERQSERPVCDEKNNDSLEEIVELRNKLYNKPPTPERIMLIGETGAGKYSIINTMHMAIAENARSMVIVAVVGLYGTGKSYLVNRLRQLSQTAIKKTPTEVLVDGMTFGAFGYEAEDKYKDLVEKDDYGHYFYDIPFKITLNKTLVESGPRNNKTDRKVSNTWYDGLTDGFGFSEIKRGIEELPKTDLNESPKHMWLQYCQAESPGESRTLLSKPLYDKRPENENFTNYSCKPVEHCTTAMKQDPIIPDNDRLLCKVCYMYELSIVFLPCSHMVACRRCAARLNSCPVCRSGIEEALPANLHE